MVLLAWITHGYLRAVRPEDRQLWRAQRNRFLDSARAHFTSGERVSLKGLR